MGGTTGSWVSVTGGSVEVVSTPLSLCQRRPDAVPSTTVVYPSLSYEGIAQGYAAFSTNTGKSSHVSRLAKLTRYHLGHQSGGRFANWAYNNTEAQKDFGYRAMSLSFQAAKSLTEKYYGREIYKKYYLGCSTAGRQGLVEAQRYPEDFDGIVSSVQGVFKVPLLTCNTAGHWVSCQSACQTCVVEYSPSSASASRQWNSMDPSLALAGDSQRGIEAVRWP
jgi:hypothetical protein